MSIVKWLHLSDLHLGNGESTETLLMQRSLPKYIASLNQDFQYLFITGDIKEWNCEYSSSIVEYLHRLRNYAHIPLQNTFIVPGNHDVDVSNRKRSSRIQKLTDWQHTAYTSRDGLISTEDVTLLRCGEEKFLSFVEQFLGKKRRKLYAQPHFVITTNDFNILHVDSTLTYAPGKNRDFILGSHMLLSALDSCDPQKTTILLTHYSFDYLTQQERNEIEFLLHNYNVHLWLAGHEHENLIRWQRDKFLECQCGNLALQNGAKSCFLVGMFDTDTGSGKIEVHAWFEQRGWAVYPFSRIGTGNDLIYPFVLPSALKAQAFHKPVVQSLDQTPSTPVNIDLNRASDKEFFSTPSAFVAQFDVLRRRAKYLDYWKITDDKYRDVPILIEEDGSIFVEGLRTEFNIKNIKWMKYDFYEEDESATITLNFEGNTSLSFSSEYHDDQLYLSLNNEFFSGRNNVLAHWKNMESNSIIESR